MFQKLGMFKSKSEPATAPVASDLASSEEIVVASKEADAAIVQRGTAVALKDVENPQEGDIESDFVFMSDILSKAGVLEGQQPQAAPELVAAPTPVPAAAMAPAKSAAPDFVPMHKRGGNGDASKPKFAVQDGPRSHKPEFLAAAEPESVEPVAAEVPVEAMAPVPKAYVVHAVPPQAVACQVDPAYAAQQQALAQQGIPPQPNMVPAQAMAPHGAVPQAVPVPAAYPQEHPQAQPHAMPPQPVPMPVPVQAVPQQAVPHQAVAPHAVPAQPTPVQAEPAPAEAPTDQLSMNFDAEPAPVVEAAPVAPVAAELPIPTAVTTPMAAQVAAASVAPAAPEPAAPVVPVSEEDISNALETLAMGPKAVAAPAQAATPCAAKLANKAAVAPAPATEENVKRKSMFASRPKTAKPPKYKREQMGDDAGFEPPKLVRKLMFAIPSNEASQSKSAHTKARLARDPFDRLMDDAQGC